MKKIAYFGIDYHNAVLAIAVIIEGSKDIHETIRLKNEDKIIRKYLKKYADTYEIRACYEASCSGYVFQRKMASWGYHCDVIAPSLIPRKPGERRKNDFRDSITLVQNYANETLTCVHLPTEHEEAVRALVRSRMFFKDEEKKIKQQITFLLMKHDILWKGKSRWTCAHKRWLSQIELPQREAHVVLEEFLSLHNYLESRIEYLEAQIEEVACTELYAESVKKLKSLRGIGTLSAMLLLTEIIDFRRFPSARALMAFLGLIPSEHSSGKTQHGGSITKTGNSRCRKQLIENAQHYIRVPNITKRMRDTLSKVDAVTADISIHCLDRLNTRYWSLVNKGKLRPVALTAIAREFVGFIWAIMQPRPCEA